jgi:cyclohexanone monooxygenase
MVGSIEQHVDWIADCIVYLRKHDCRGIEATVEVEDGWVAHVNEVGDATLYPLANSWYTGANIRGKPRIFMLHVGGVVVYREKCDDVAPRATRDSL